MNELTFNARLAETLAHSILFFAREGSTAWGVLRADLSPSAPPPRNLAQEGKDTLQAQIDLAPQQYAAEAMFRPQYAQLNTDVLKAQLPQLAEILGKNQPALSDLFNAANRSQRESDLATVEQLGGRATEAFRNANPQQRALMDSLNASALSGLNAGTGLTPDEVRNFSEDVAGAQASRGLGRGPADVYQQALTLDAGRNRRLQERQQFGTQIAGLNQATTADPFQAILGRQSQSAGAGLGLLNNGGQLTQGGPQQFNPFTSYGSDLFNTNYNADAAARIAGSNNAAAVTGASISALGNAL